MEDGAAALAELQISVGTDFRVVENTLSSPFRFWSFRGSEWRRISNGSNSFVCNTPHFQVALYNGLE